MYICGSCFSQIDDRAITDHNNPKCFNKRCINNGHKLFYADDSISNIVAMLMRSEFLIEFNSLKGFSVNSLKGNVTSVEVPFITISSEYPERMEKFIELLMNEGGKEFMIPFESFGSNQIKLVSENNDFAYRPTHGYPSKYAKLSITSNVEAFRRFTGTTITRTVKNQAWIVEEYRRFGKFMAAMHMATMKYIEYRNERIIAKREEMRALNNKKDNSNTHEENGD